MCTCSSDSLLPALAHVVSQTLSIYFLYMSQSYLPVKIQQPYHLFHEAFPHHALWKLSPLPIAFQSILSVYFFSFYFFPFIFISWRLITLQYCSGFCHTLT